MAKKISKLPMPNKFQSTTIRVTNVARISNKIVIIEENKDVINNKNNKK